MAKSITVSYSASQSFISSSSWAQILQTLDSQLPLRNIHWKSSSRTSIRTIHELDVSLVNLDTIRDEQSSQIPTTLLERPLLNIYVITCENHDIEAYRATVKKQIKEWHATISGRKNQEWLILHVVRADSRVQSGALFTLRGSVLDKVRADFNTDKRERCVQLVWSGGTNNPAIWAEFLNKLRDGVLSAFEVAVLQREDEVRRSEGQRQMPGWNFCTFFILKESLATSFEGITLYDDALLVYEELEFSFDQVSKEKNLSWFGSLITPGPTDDSAPLLSNSKKAYRDLILANNISIFDFRIYLLSRQCELLAKAGRVTEVCKKVGMFLSAFGRRLREAESEIPPFFVEAWIYSSALSVVDQVDVWAANIDLDAKQPVFDAGKAELLELARNQLDMLGIENQFLPFESPFSSFLASEPAVSKSRSSEKISNSQLSNALQDQVAFYDLYIHTTNRAIELYANSGRRKFALKLHGSLAALDLHRGRSETAFTTYHSLPAHYAPHMWTSLESAMLSKALETHTITGKSKDREWIHILLAFFKTYAESEGAELLMSEESKIEYVSKLMSSLEKAVSELDTDLLHPNHPALKVLVSSSAILDENRDGSYLEVTVQNFLPCPIPSSEVSVLLTGRDSERFKFTSTGDESLSPGPTKLNLFCPIPCHGSFLLDSSEIRMNKLLLQWSHRKTTANTKSARSTGKDSNVLVRIPQDLLAFDVRLRQPPLVALGAPPNLLVIIATGRNEVLTTSFKLTAPSVSFDCQDAILSTKGISLPDISSDRVSLRDLPEDKHVELLIPHSDVSNFHSIKVTVEVDYTTVSEPLITRSLRLTRSINTILPVSVNVEDFFRGNRLFSKFIVSTLSHQHVRISNARLGLPDADGVKIQACSSSKRGIITVTPAQSAQFVFQISSNGPVREALSLDITYRMLREEVEFVVEEAVESAIRETPSWKRHRIPLVSKLIQMLEKDATWVELYGISGELHIPGSPVSDDPLREPVEAVKKMLQLHKHPDAPTGPWHEIKIPVDVPVMDIVAAAQIKISAERDTPLYAGQPIPVTLSVHSSFHWGTSAHNKEQQYVMQYDVEEIVKEWLVSGKKRGTFVATDDGIFTVPLTLVALHHGEFSLPKVSVSALPLADAGMMGSTAFPNTEAYQVHGAKKVLISPRGGRSTFVLGMGST